MPEANPKFRGFRQDRLAVEIHPDRRALGLAAARAAAAALRFRLSRQAGVRVVFASAPSQDEFLAALVLQPDIEWRRVTAFHMDEYVGLDAAHPAGFRTYLAGRLASRVNLGAWHQLAGEAKSPEAECLRYADLLRQAPVDLVCLGIGENGHLAFNDPPVADFQDPHWVKSVALERACRVQQVNDGCFATLEEVPEHALTLTIPALMAGRRLICIVPGPRKAAAVAATLEGPIHARCPASILRTHPRAQLLLDRDAAAGLQRDDPSP